MACAVFDASSGPAPGSARGLALPEVGARLGTVLGSGLFIYCWEVSLSRLPTGIPAFSSGGVVLQIYLILLPRFFKVPLDSPPYMFWPILLYILLPMASVLQVLLFWTVRPSLLLPVVPGVGPAPFSMWAPLSWMPLAPRFLYHQILSVSPEPSSARAFRGLLPAV